MTGSVAAVAPVLNISVLAKTRAPAAVENVIQLTEGSRSWSQPFAAAAAVVLIAGIAALIGFNRPQGSPETADRFVPVHAQNTYEGSNVDGVVFTKDNSPMQAVRHQFTDTYTWENKDGSRVELRIPVERVRYVPVQTD